MPVVRTARIAEIVAGERGLSLGCADLRVKLLFLAAEGGEKGLVLVSLGEVQLALSGGAVQIGVRLLDRPRRPSDPGRQQIVLPFCFQLVSMDVRVGRLDGPTTCRISAFWTSR